MAGIPRPLKKNQSIKLEFINYPFSKLDLTGYADLKLVPLNLLLLIS